MPIRLNTRVILVCLITLSAWGVMGKILVNGIPGNLAPSTQLIDLRGLTMHVEARQSIAEYSARKSREMACGKISQHLPFVPSAGAA